MSDVSSKNLYCKITSEDIIWNTFFGLKSESYQLATVNMLFINNITFFTHKKVDKN